VIVIVYKKVYNDVSYHSKRRKQTMSDIFQRVKDDQNWFQKILGKVPGFSGYFERQNRRASDKVLRDAIAERFEALWRRISVLQTDLISQGGLAYVDDLESAAIKLRQFIDRVRMASYGYAGFFDSVKINQDELAQIYQYDFALLSMEDEVGRGIDNVEASLGTDGLPAAIRNLRTLAQQCVDAYNRREEVMAGGVPSMAPEQPQQPVQPSQPTPPADQSWQPPQSPPAPPTDQTWQPPQPPPPPQSTDPQK
jgi:hypothetical protein